MNVKFSNKVLWILFFVFGCLVIFLIVYLVVVFWFIFGLIVVRFIDKLVVIIEVVVISGFMIVFFNEKMIIKIYLCF